MNAFPLFAAIPPVILFGGALVLGLIGLILLFLFIQYFSLWIQCRMTKAGISFIDLVMMRLRKVDTATIVRGKIMAVVAGLRSHVAALYLPHLYDLMSIVIY